jgi:hypothetical protein
MIGEDALGIIEGSFDFASSMTAVLSGALGLATYCYSSWTGIVHEPFDIKLRPDAPHFLHAHVRHIAKGLYEPAKNSIMKFVDDAYLILDYDCMYSSPIVVVPKPKEPLMPRICGDYTSVNAIIMHYPMSIPDPKKLFDSFSKYKWFAETDWIKSFHQIPITEKSQKLLSISTPFGNFRPRFLPEGVQPASGILAHVVRKIFGDLSDICISAQDNLVIGGHTLEDLHKNFIRVLERCREYNVKLSPDKTKIGLRAVEFFGYIFTEGSYKINPKRQSAIAEIEWPRNKKFLQQFLGMCLFVSPFINNYAELTAPLTELLKTTSEWPKNGSPPDELMQCFQKIKAEVAAACAVYLPDMDAEWILRTDASDIACGGVLLQRVLVNKAWELHPIAYVSHKFSKTAQAWSVIEKEMYAMVFCLQRLEYYLRYKHFTTETDHSNIIYLKQTIIPKLIRWRLFIHSFYMTIRHIPGKSNVMADALSRLFFMQCRQLNEPQMQILLHLGHVYAEQATTETAQLYAMSEIADIELTDTVSFSALLHVEIANNPVATYEATDDSVELQQAWKQCHCRGKSHRGAKRTYIELGRQYPNMHISMAWVQAKVDSCFLCQKFRADVNTALKTARHVLLAEGHKSQISVDLVGMEEDAHGNNTCAVICDHKSKLIFLHASKGKGELNSINAVLSYISFYGLVDTILSDPGGEFSGASTKSLMEKLGIKWNLTIADRPQSHGTERSVGKVLEAMRFILADGGDSLNWSEPAVLAVTQHQLNSEINAETGFTPYQLVFGENNFREIPDFSNTEAKATLRPYLDDLSAHLRSLRDQADIRRQQRQRNRLDANTPPGSHTYLAGDLVFIRDESPMRARKFIARNLGPYQVVEQRDDGAVSIRSLVDQSLLQRHHNALRIFEGSLRDATILARLDNKETLIISIDEFDGSVYDRSRTRWRVNWEDNSITWESYRAVQYCQQLKDFAASKFFLKRRFTCSGEDFKDWGQHVNGLTYTTLLEQSEGYFPTVDERCRSPFAWSIFFFKELQEVQDIPTKNLVGGKTAYKLQSSDWNSFVTAYLVKKTPTKYDLFIPALSRAKEYKKFPARGAYLISVSPAQILQFAHALPPTRKGMFNADQEIGFTTLRELVWPETWDAQTSLLKTLAQPANAKIGGTDEEDELLAHGEHTGCAARVKTRGKWYPVTLHKKFPDGDYLAVFEDQTEARVPFRLINLSLLQRRVGGSDV